MPMNHPFFERCLKPGERALATVELAAQGSAALPILEALFSGEAKNQWGISYKSLGTPLDCGLIVAARLGEVAKPIERHLVVALKCGHVYAAAALGALGDLDDISIGELAMTLDGSATLSFEAADALVRCGAAEHPDVTAITRLSQRAATAMERVTSGSRPRL